MKNITIVLPALNPDQKMIEVVNGLLKAGFEDILIVDDGSDARCSSYFEQAAQHPECRILRHNKNLGKGRALKTAFNDYLNHSKPESLGVVTVDADNQHHIDDIVRCAKALQEHPDSLILGTRDFNAPNIPFRSRFGNKLTIGMFRFACGIRVSDTQGGLRAIPRALTREFLDLYGERFEYETSMLMEIRNQNLSVVEVPIRTIYLEKNKSSHFNPILDSFRIYRVLLKFIISSAASLGVDFLMFWLILRLLGTTCELSQRLFAATVLARIVSSLVNYALNRTAVFGSNGSVKSTVYRYYLLCAVQMLCSYGGVYLLCRIFPPSIMGAEVISKLVVDFCLFLLSFHIQREWVFKRH